MSLDTDKREAEREAVAGDPAAQERLRVSRCRAGECCAHATGPKPLYTPDGCATCPFLGWRTDNEVPRCNLDGAVPVPLDNDDNPMAAVPAACPLWNGPVLVDLHQLREMRR